MIEHVDSGVELALYSPRIAANVGAIGRLCAVTRTPLHVIRPIPFNLDDRTLKRSGMDYWDFVRLSVHEGWESFASQFAGRRIWLFSTRGEKLYTDVEYRRGDVMLFGNEPSGVPDAVREALRKTTVRIPQLDERTRSLNLSMACAIAVYEGIRQIQR